MPDHRELILHGLTELRELCAKVDANCWVTFTANRDEHWIQCCPGQINMDWPFSHAPEPQQLLKYFPESAPIEIVAWDIDLYATFNIAATTDESLVSAVLRVFQDLYELGPEFELTCTVEAG
ncbi:MAG: hypothetical protein IPK15_04190 [Verrucomicrobia bacterium]|nr:hypothetical protein [Verrucomicrobiota bacterium]